MRTDLLRIRRLLTLALLAVALLGSAAPAQEAGRELAAAAVPGADQGEGAANQGDADQGAEDQSGEDQSGEDQSGGDQSDGGHGDHGHSEVPSTMDMPRSEIFGRQFGHMVPYVWFQPEISTKDETNKLFAVYNTNVFQWFVLVVLALVFLPVVLNRSSSNPSRYVRIFRGWVHWIRDEMVYAILGKDEGRAFAPFFIFMFFFIAGMNALSLVPSFGIISSYTATASIYVTGALAAVTFGMMLFFGMKQQGAVKYWVNLIPHGLPFWLLPIMIPVELVGLVVKPTALTLRLFANLLAGHLVLYSFIGLIFVFAQMFDMGAVSYATAVPALGLAVFVNTLEAFITLLQAYIFVYLSLIFVQQAMHPAH